MMKKKNNEEVARLVSRYISKNSPEIQAVLSSLRALVKEAVPDVVESFKWNIPCYELRGVFIALIAHRDHVNLEFHKGVSLPDPDGLLEGTGKRLRHIKIKVPAHLEQIGTATLKGYISEAAALQGRR
jgi:hypothetical protein